MLTPSVNTENSQFSRASFAESVYALTRPPVPRRTPPKYLVTITGDNLDKFEEDALVDNELIEIKEIKKNSQQIQYEFEIQRDAMCVELRGLNQGKADTVIYKIELNKAE